MIKILLLFSIFYSSLQALDDPPPSGYDYWYLYDYSTRDYCTTSGDLDAGTYKTLNDDELDIVIIYQVENTKGCDSIQARNETYKYAAVTLEQEPCPDGQVVTDNYICENPPVICSDTQYLDDNGTCSEVSLPDGFPTADNKGFADIKKYANTEDNCIIGTKYDTAISHAEVIGWDSSSNECLYASFFCNSGLEWDKSEQTCKIPLDQENTPTDGTISSDLGDSCSSGQWVKSHVYDYCSSDSIVSSVAFDYNLEARRKYIEYDCTSDYRLKYFKRVACGPVAIDSYDEVNLSITGSSDSLEPTNVKVDANSTTTTTNVASVINSASSKLGNKVDNISSKLDITNSILNSIDGKLSSSDDNIVLSYSEDEGQKSNRESIDSGLSDIYGVMASIKGDYERFQSVLANGLPTPIFTSGERPEFCTVVFGKEVCLNLCDSFSTFRSIFYFIFTSVFMLAALRIYWSAFKNR